MSMMNTSKNRILVSWISLVLVLFLSLGMFAVPAHAVYNNEVELDSDIVYMESLDQGTVIFNKNAKKKTAMASLTKICTAIVVLDKVKDLESKVTVKQEVMDTLAGTNSSTAGISTGEVLTVNQLLNLMLVHSANESAAILADYVGGDINSFVGMMNAYAQKLGCKNTHFMNPHGLDEDGHYTTAEDLAKIIKYALKNDVFKKIVAQAEYTLPDTNKRETVTYSNTNFLLNKNSNYYYEPCRGIKTGTTENAGQCLASYATQNGYTYICIVIGGKDLYASSSHDINRAFNDTVRAYKWVFDNIKLKTVASPANIVTVADIDLARKVDTVQLVPAKEITALLPSDVDTSGVSIEVVDGSVNPKLHAPVKAGEVLGKADILYADDKLCIIDLVAAQDVHRSFFGSIWYCITSLFHFLIVKVALAVLLLGGLLYWIIYRSYQKSQTRNNINMVRPAPGTKGAKTLKGTSTQHRSKQPNRKRSKK